MEELKVRIRSDDKPRIKFRVECYCEKSYHAIITVAKRMNGRCAKECVSFEKRNRGSDVYGSGEIHLYPASQGDAEFVFQEIKNSLCGVIEREVVIERINDHRTN